MGADPILDEGEAKDSHINARAETVDKLPMFREAFAGDAASFQRQASTSGRSGNAASSPIASRGRTLSRSPLPGYGVRPHRRRGHPIGSNHRRRSELTRKPHTRSDASHAHVRDYDRWLGPATDMHELKAMLKPYDPALMEAYAVSRVVNSVKNDTEECIEPLQ